MTCFANHVSLPRQQLAGTCLRLASMTGDWNALVACVAGKEEGEEKNGSLSIARHVCACDRDVPESSRKMFPMREGQMTCLTGMYNPPSNC